MKFLDYFKNKKRLIIENEMLKRKIEEDRIVRMVNTDAHNNLLRQLNQANLRIVEFEKIKKEHLEYVKTLKRGNNV